MRLLVTLTFLVVGLSANATPDPSPSALACTRLEPMESHPERLDLSSLTDVEELYEALGALAAPKDDFETTAQYEERMSRLRQETRIGGRALTDTFTVMAPISRLYFNYDADRQTVLVEHMLGTATVPFGMQYPTGDTPSHSAYEDRFDSDIYILELELDSRDGDSYEASNAYGREVTVEVSYMTKYNVVLMNVLGDFGCEGQHVRFQAPSATARDLQDNLAAVVKFDLRRPYAVESFFYVEPTIDRHKEISVTEYNVIGRALEVYLVDKTTGRVLGAYRPA